MTLRIEIRDLRLQRGRLSIDARTSAPKERDRRRAILVQLLETERGRGIIDRMRRREVTLDQIIAAVDGFDLASLEAVPMKAGAGPIGLGETINRWLAWLQGADRSPETLAFYRSISRGLEAHMGVQRDRDGAVTKDRPITEITRAEGEEWLSGRKKTTGKSWSPRTQTVAHSLAAQIWDRAITEDEERSERSGAPRTLERNFWRRQGSRKGIRAARIRRTRVEYLRRPEAARLLRRLKGSPHGAWVAVGIYAGLRGGEAANLRLGLDVDMGAGLLRIQSRGGEHAWRPKTDNSVRNVPIHPALARWLRKHIALGYAGELYLFRLPGTDRPFGRSTWRVWTKKAFERGGIRYGRRKDALVHHSLRHTLASWLTIADVHPLKISRLMGDTVNEVIKTYSHLVQDDLIEAVRRI